VVRLRDDVEFYRLARDFFGLRSKSVSQEVPPEPQEEKPDRLPELLADKMKACLAHVRAVVWGEAHADCEVTDGDFRLLVRMSVKSTGKVEKIEKKP
jgi:hypothetical protein